MAAPYAAAATTPPIAIPAVMPLTFDGCSSLLLVPKTPPSPGLEFSLSPPPPVAPPAPALLSWAEPAGKSGMAELMWAVMVFTEPASGLVGSKLYSGDIGVWSRFPSFGTKWVGT